MVTQAETRAAWNKLAADFDTRITPHNIAFAERILQRVNLRPEVRFLDVAAGTGALSIPAARLGAQVVAIDISPAMIERLMARARAERLSNVEGRVMDGQNLELEDEMFDFAGSMAGLMLFPDLPRGLREMVRVTKPTGRVLVIAFGPPERVEFVAFFFRALREVVPDLSDASLADPPLPFQLANPQVLSQRMVEAGLHDVQVETETLHVPFRSGHQLWDELMASNPIATLLVADLTDKQKGAVRQILDRLVRERAGGSDVAMLTLQLNIGLGTR